MSATGTGVREPVAAVRPDHWGGLSPDGHGLLAGIFDPRGARTAADDHAISSLFPGRPPMDAWRRDELWVARTHGSTGAGVAGVTCHILGRARPVATRSESRHGAPEPGAPPERLVAAGFRHGGPAILRALRGEFVALIWDERESRGLIAQDRLGGRSVYYCSDGPRIYFASDLAVLLRLLPRQPAPDRLALTHHLLGSFPPIERTVYEGVRRLCGGHLLELDQSASRKRYWGPGYVEPAPVSPEELHERLWEVVRGVVRERMTSAGAVGIIMSGGVDSSTVAAAAVSERADAACTLRGYSAVFPSLPQVDESERIDSLVEAIGLPSVQLEPRPGGILHLALEYLRVWKTPLTGPGYLVEHPLLRRAAADGVAVVLDGQGGDEVFGLSPFLLADRLRRGRILSSLALARRFPGTPSLGRSLGYWRQFGAKAALPHALYERLRRREDRNVPDYLSAAAGRLFQESEDRYSWKKRRTGPLWWSYKAWLLTEGREWACLPEYVRHRAAMVGIEARSPLLDHRVVELALGYPAELDFGAFDRPNIRAALRGRVPDPVRWQRPKCSLGPFYQRGLIGADLPVVRDLLTGSKSHVRWFVRPGDIDALLGAPPSLGHDRRMHFTGRVWGLLKVESFLRQQEDAGFAERLLDDPALVRAGAGPVDRRLAAVS